jgi:hypothetical protein
MAALLTISTEPFEHPAMDYAFLRREGIRLLERLGGKLWTDFNTHDPGITILEQVCYALTDLAYRTNYDIKDLLASGAEDPYRSLYSPAEVLTTNPVTLIDLRKLLLDISGVKNAWVERVEKPVPGMVYDPSEDCIYLETSAAQPAHREPVSLRGIYRVVIEKDADSNVDVTSLLSKVNDRLQSCRSLGEDVAYPEVLPGQPILVNAEIEIGAVDDPELLLAKIYLALADFISPRVQFHTLSELLDQGKSIDEILNGPVLEHGFIEDAELERLARKADLRTSDLIQEIMNLEGVVAVNEIRIASGSASEEWYLKLDMNRAPFLDIHNSLFPASAPRIRLSRKGIPVRPDPSEVQRWIQSLRTTFQDELLPVSQRDLRLPAGRDRKISQYHSIQHQFPATYGVGTLGLPESASTQRKAQAKQLKAYLMFFDQLLANYFAQLANCKDLFSFYSVQSPTYFSQILEDAGLTLDGIRVWDESTHAAKIQSYTENPASAAERKNRFLNHLLARFAEQFTDYSLLLYAHLKPKDLIDDKSAFLQDYKEIGSSRGTGFNYTVPSLNSKNTSGLEKRIKRKLGISNVVKRQLAGLDAGSEGGFHVLEHILLRPRLADSDQFKQDQMGIDWQAGAFLAQSGRKDPYSHQLSFIFPEWVTRFDQSFRQLIEKTLREETPAHIKVYLHWLNKEEMRAFENAQKDWLDHVIAGQVWKPASQSPGEDYWKTHMRLRDARDRMIEVLEIGLPYPLRDLQLNYPTKVAFEEPAQIQIVAAQAGVVYQLCDEDGNPIPGDGFKVWGSLGQGAEKVFLPTPKIRAAVTFTILAIREGKVDNIRLEVYLNQSIFMEVGIDNDLPVAFQPEADQRRVSDTEIIINFGDKVTVKVSETQEGISYKLILISNPEEQPKDFSEPQKGNTGEISLVSLEGFPEDTTLNILAYRTTDKSDFEVLKAGLIVKVRPKIAIPVRLKNIIVNYDSETEVSLELADVQPSAGYQLYKRELVPADYVSDETTGRIELQTEEGRRVFIPLPENVANWENPNGFVPVDAFKQSGTKLIVATGKLLEDTIFLVRATKTENGESLQLAQAVVVLVRPNPAVAVSVSADPVERDTPGEVVLKDTQKGVAYQLRLDVDNQPVNLPGYHLTDRALETTRIGVDFVIEDQGSPDLLLPTGNLTRATRFNVLASKILTGVSKELTGKVTIHLS